MPAFTVCPECGAPALSSSCRCPSCGHTVRGCNRSLSATAALLGLGLVACGDKDGTEPAYGVPDTSYTDQDGDGYTIEEGDCDDNDASLNPGATETPGDTIDSNCDGGDDT